MTFLRVLAIWLFCCVAASAQLPSNPNQYVPQPGYTMGVTPNLQPFYTPSWIGSHAVTANTTLNDGCATLQTISSASGSVTVTLPSTQTPTGATGHPLAFKVINFTGSITLAAASGDTIDGMSTFSMSALNQCVILETDGTHTWRVLVNTAGGSGGGGITSLSTTFPGMQVTSPTTTPVISAATGQSSHLVLGTFGGNVITLGSLSTSDLPSVTDTHLYVGNSSNIPTDTAISGDATLSNTGVLTLKNTGPGAETVTNASITIDAQGRTTALSTGSNPVFGADGSDGAITNPTFPSTPTNYNATNFSITTSQTPASGTVVNTTGTFTVSGSGNLTIGLANNAPLSPGKNGTGVCPGYSGENAGDGAGGGGCQQPGGVGGLAIGGQAINNGGVSEITQTGMTGSSGAYAPGGTAGAPGSGGGSFKVCSVGAITLSAGLIDATGQAATNSTGAAGGSGGGAGGSIAMYSQTSIIGTGGTLKSYGGDGGAGGTGGNTGGGGCGGCGWVLLMAPSITAPTVSLYGGNGGTGNGTGGTGSHTGLGAAISITGKPTLPLIASIEKHTSALYVAVANKIMRGQAAEITKKVAVSLLASLEGKKGFESLCFELENGEDFKKHREIERVGVGDTLQGVMQGNG